MQEHTKEIFDRLAVSVADLNKLTEETRHGISQNAIDDTELAEAVGDISQTLAELISLMHLITESLKG